MDTLHGTVSNAQHTLRVSGGANNTSTTTTYIALFRVGGRPVEFRTNRPTSVSDGDEVIVCGLPGGALTVLACRNVTTGETMNVGIWGNLIAAVIAPIIGVLACVFFVGNFGSFAVMCVIGVVGLITAYLVHRVILTVRADKLVSG